MTKTEVIFKINTMETEIKAIEAGAAPNASWGLGYLKGKLTICREVLADIEQKEIEEDLHAKDHYSYALANDLEFHFNQGGGRDKSTQYKDISDITEKAKVEAYYE